MFEDNVSPVCEAFRQVENRLLTEGKIALIARMLEGETASTITDIKLDKLREVAGW